MKNKLECQQTIKDKQNCWFDFRNVEIFCILFVEGSLSCSTVGPTLYFKIKQDQESSSSHGRTPSESEAGESYPICYVIQALFGSVSIIPQRNTTL